MSVDKLPDGKYFYRFKYKKESYRHQGFITQEEAEYAEAMKKAEVIRIWGSGQGPNDGLLLFEACDTYFKEYSLTGKKSPKSDRAHITSIKKFFGNRRLRDISPRDVEKFRLWVPKNAKGR